MTELDRPARRTNQIVGLLVMLGGVALLVLVFLWSYRLYEGIGPETLQVRPAQSQPAVKGLSPERPARPGALTGTPNPAAAVPPQAIAYVLRLLALLVMGWVAAVIASRGILLAASGARPVRAHPEEHP